MNSRPSRAAARSGAGCGLRCSATRPLCFSVNATSGRASAMRRNTSLQWPNSVASVRRNLRRAGVWKYRSDTCTVVPCARAAGSTGEWSGPSARSRWAFLASAVRDVSASRDTDAIDASASPRNPIEATASSSSSVAILLVAWRASARVSSSAGMPAPSSSTCTRFAPPSSSVTVTAVAPASRLFSSSSFSTEAGRSTTSPAAIWLTSRSDSSRIKPRPRSPRRR